MDIGTAKVGAAGPGAGPAPRAGPRRPRRAVHGGRFPAICPGGPGGHRARGRPPSWSAGTGLYLRAVARGLPMDRPVTIRSSGRSWRTGSTTDGLPALLAELQSHRPDGMRAGRPREPPARHPGHRACARRGRRATAGARGLPGARGLAGDRRPGPTIPEAIEARVRDQFRDGLLDEAAGLRDRYGEDLRAVRRDGLPGGVRRPGRPTHHGVGHPARHRAHPQLCQSSAHLVPGGTRHPLARVRTRGGGGRACGRRSTLVDGSRPVTPRTGGRA